MCLVFGGHTCVSSIWGSYLCVLYLEVILVCLVFGVILVCLVFEGHTCVSSI